MDAHLFPAKSTRRGGTSATGCLLLGLFLAMAGCGELFETDISERMVVVLEPADSLVSTRFAQTFRWKALEGARSYRLEVASPSLADPSVFFEDTLTDRLSVRLSLPAGRFEWRLRARNAGYETGAVGRSLRIEPSADLGAQQMLLLKPADGSMVGGNQVVFTWEALPTADAYILHVPELRLSDTVRASTRLLVLPALPGRYSWRVTAFNRTSRLLSRDTYTFSVDLAAPAAPLLLNPADNTFLPSLPVTLSWQRSENGIVRDSVYLYTAGHTVIAGFPRASVGTSFRIERSSAALGAGTYYWAARSVGVSGKAGALSEKRRFTLF